MGRELTYNCNAMHCRSGLIATPMLGLLYLALVFEFVQKLHGKACAYALWAGLGVGLSASRWSVKQLTPLPFPVN